MEIKKKLKKNQTYLKIYKIYLREKQIKKLINYLEEQNFEVDESKKTTEAIFLKEKVLKSHKQFKNEKLKIQQNCTKFGR